MDAFDRRNIAGYRLAVEQYERRFECSKRLGEPPLPQACSLFAVVYPGSHSRIAALNAEVEDLQDQRFKLQSQLDTLETGQNPDGEQSGKKADMKDAGKVGDTIENNGIKMKLDAVDGPQTLNYDTGTGGNISDEYAPKSPDAGTKYWVANVEITNTGKKPIDISCGYPLDVKALNDGGQEFAPMKEIFKVQGNPECNAQLQPGMTSKVVYPFMVPSDTDIVGLKWQGIDVDNLGANKQYDYFKLK